jgi:hypothetical protein
MIRIRRKQETEFVVNTVDIVCIFDDDDVNAEAKKDDMGVKYNTQKKAKRKDMSPSLFITIHSTVSRLVPLYNG